MDGKTIIEVVMEAAYEAQVDEVTMRELEALILPEVQIFTPDEIKRLRVVKLQNWLRKVSSRR